MAKLSKEKQKRSDSMDEHFERNSFYINNKEVKKSNYIIEKTHLLIDDIEYQVQQLVHFKKKK